MISSLLEIEQDVKKAEADDVIKAFIIEDSKLDQMILKKMLISSGYDVSIASNAHMAIDMFDSVQPDIVFMDLYLPDASGYELTKILKGRSRDNYIPVLFVTGANDDESLEKCLESGGDDFIVKPIRESLLKARTNSLLRVKKIHDELLLEKEAVSAYRDEQIKDLHDAKRVIYNIQKPRFYNSGNIQWSYQPQNILSGDVICSAISPSGNHMFLLGDNTGHGTPAAIGSMIIFEIFYSMVNKGFDIQLIIEEINKKLYYLLPTDRFLAACIIDIDSDYHVMKLWNAGIPDIIIFDSEGVLKETLPSIHLPLGIILINAGDIVPSIVNLNQGDRLYAYTDGLTESFNMAGEIYGQQRLLESIQSSQSIDKRVDAITNDIKKFSDGIAPSDDISLLEINCDTLLIKKHEKHKINSNEIVPMDWNIQFELKTQVICKLNPIPILIQMMADIQGFAEHREKIFLILTEMYSNSIEHGILKLDSDIKKEKGGFNKYYQQRQSRLENIEDATLSIIIGNRVESSKGVLSISIEHNGDEFDYQQSESKLVGNEVSFGRGVALLKKMCRKFEYSKNGKMLSIEYEW